MPSGRRALHDSLDTWHGIGLVEHGLARQERDLELIRYGDRWVQRSPLLLGSG
jgi:hypothetical protein